MGKRGSGAGLAWVGAPSTTPTRAPKRHKLSNAKNQEYLDRLATQDQTVKFNEDLAMVTSALRANRDLMPSVRQLVVNYLASSRGEFPRCVRNFGDIPMKDPTRQQLPLHQLVFLQHWLL